MVITSKRGSTDNVVTYEFICDTAADLQDIDPKNITLGSVAIVLQSNVGGLEVYMANSHRQWINLGGVVGGENSNNSSNNTNEYSGFITGFPTVLGNGETGIVKYASENITIDSNNNISGKINYACNGAYFYTQPSQFVNWYQMGNGMTALIPPYTSYVAPIMKLQLTDEFISQSPNLSQNYYELSGATQLTENIFAIPKYMYAPYAGEIATKIELQFFEMSAQQVNDFYNLYITQNTSAVEEYINNLTLIASYDVTQLQFQTQEEWEAQESDT